MQNGGAAHHNHQASGCQGGQGWQNTGGTQQDQTGRREQSRQPSTYTRWSGCMLACGRFDVTTPRFTDRVTQAQRLVDNRDHTPALPDADRELLSNTLRRLRRAVVERGGAEQLLHGEPHPGNLLRTKHGLLFADLETCCRGPVEFDIAHAPEAVSVHFPGADQQLVQQCRVLVLAMIVTWRWDRDDDLPNGRQLGLTWLNEMRVALERYGLDMA
jgi:hypothetical protein